MTQDPSGLGPDANPYRYCGNGPTDGMDPSGLCNGSAGGGNPGRFKGSGVFVLDKASRE
ncbi:MAG: hypothetical protein ACLQLG_00760 [Thermoguttaceae bacterium]